MMLTLGATVWAIVVLVVLATITAAHRSVRCCWFGHRPLHPDWASRCRRCGLDAWQQADEGIPRLTRWVLLVSALIALWVVRS